MLSCLLVAFQVWHCIDLLCGCQNGIECNPLHFQHVVWPFMALQWKVHVFVYNMVLLFIWMG